MKKLIALLLAVLMLMSVFTGCGDKQETTDPTEPTPSEDVSTPAEDNTDPEPAEEAERVTLTIGLQQNALVEDYETNDYTKFLEDSLNVDLDFVYFSNDNSEASTQLSLMISGGERLPDILWGFDNLDRNMFFEYGEDGYLVDLTDYLNEETAPNIFEQISYVQEKDRDKILGQAKDPNNGAIYGIPYYVTPDVDNCTSHAWVNTAFLETLDMEAPTTVDELYDFLKAVVNEDPNGNGVGDEVGLLTNGGYRANMINFIINAFVYIHDSYLLNATDGELWFPYTTDEYRQAMIYLNKLVGEGLISELCFSLPNDAFSDIAAIATPSDQVHKLGVLGAHMLLVPETDNPLALDYEPLAPLKDATGKGGYATYYASTLAYGTMITTDCENPDIAFKLLDFMSSEDSVLRMRYGVEGKSWQKATEGTSALGNPANVEILDASIWANQSNQVWHIMSGCIMTDVNWSPLLAQDDSWQSQVTRNVYSVMDAYETAPNPDEVVQSLIYTSEENEQVAEIKSNVKSYVRSARALFATGNMDPNDDAQWQSYLDNLESMGLQTYLEVSQTAYDRMK